MPDRAWEQLFFPAPVALPPSAYTEKYSAFADALRRVIVGKARQSNKEAKKQAVLTPKEKKAAKRAKKHSSDIVPLISR